MEVFNAAHGKMSTRGEPQKKILYEHEGGFKIQSIALAAGCVIPPCAMSRNVMFYIISGSGTITVDGETQDLQAGAGCVVPASCKTRSITAHTDMTILAVQGEIDHGVCS